ncbi:BMP family ABC transporter substrate-binding protein [Hansschlegelia quercus]|uniref:BMP family ABC transporter substrate-binding protein n=1 Tax=Hansschlegelia quercus TaxID=2528245 RepID=A0A4Q9GHV0_9HYPH|nr:BMP family ABC transporter substrate-binding protein [Hansschlegelia quercus]TBN48256.1 BMP family ABC transporter substrate-binding protein [Hansschlegelia quercus]
MAGRHTRRDVLKVGGAAAAGLALSPLGSGSLRAAQPLKIGVAYVSPIADIGWTKQHSLGVDAIKAKFGDKVAVTVIESVTNPQDAERTFGDMAASGHKLIFGTSFSHGTPLQKAAKRFPDVKFEHCSGIVHLKNLGTFEAKYYEGTYLAGIAAGKMSKTGKIGFIGGFPIPDIVGPANALLLGAQSVRPDATCSTIFLNSWFDPGKEKDAAAALIAQGCDVICGMTDTPTSVQAAENAGVWGIGYASDMSKFAPTKHLTAFTLDWTSEYVGATQKVLDGTWTSEERWDGLKEGVVKMSPYNAAIPDDVKALLAEKEAAIKSGALHPFSGEIRAQNGEVKVAAGVTLDAKGIRSINWFVKGMSGSPG